jgi:putative oxidoreductase
MSHQPSLLNRIARVLLCLVFIHAVIGKLTGFAGVAGAIAAKGLPLAPVLLVAAMALMVVGSALVISGRKARLGAVLLLVFLVPTTPAVPRRCGRQAGADSAVQEPGDHGRPAAGG